MVNSSSIQAIKVTGIRNRQFQNWSETCYCRPEFYFEPKNRQQLRQILRLALAERKIVRIVGCGNSPCGDLPFTDQYLVSLKYFDRLLQFNEDLCQVKVEAGITLTKLNDVHLPKLGMGLRIVGAISDITVAGAVSTATHGSGLHFGTIASYVTEMEVMIADGCILKCNRETNSTLFLATCCGLGALGVIVTITIQCERAYNLQLNRFPATLTAVLECLDVHLTSSDHFRFYWYPHTENVVVDHISRTNKSISKRGFLEKTITWFRDNVVGYYTLEFAYWLSSFAPFLIPKINSYFYVWLNSTPKINVDRSDRIFNIECLFKQYVSEWSIPIEKTAVVLYELKEWLAMNPTVYVHFPVEVRFVKSEDFYLSPAYGRDSCYINIIMYRPYGKAIPHERYWTAYQNIMRRYDGRPHWAKTHSVTAKEFSKLYDNYYLWCDIRSKYDADGLFMNEYLNKIVID